jgi:bacterioferritin-associated ferredoxin
MIVCVCHRVSDRDIQREAHRGCASFEELQDKLPVGGSCGACADCARQTFERACAYRQCAGAAGLPGLALAAI